jgi:hypothetical protein
VKVYSTPFVRPVTVAVLTFAVVMEPDGPPVKLTV